MKNLSSIINLEKIVFNPFLFSIPISCPLNTSENQRLSRVFWGLKNGNIGQKWANSKIIEDDFLEKLLSVAITTNMFMSAQNINVQS